MLMTELEKLREAQDFIARELQKKGIGRVDAVNWAHDPHDAASGIHRLIVLRSGEKFIFTFTEYELLENYGSKQWEKRLRGYVSEVMIEF